MKLDESVARAAMAKSPHNRAAIPPVAPKMRSSHWVLQIGGVVIIVVLVAGIIVYAAAAHGGTAKGKAAHNSVHRVTSASSCRQSRPIFATIDMLTPNYGVGISFVSVDCKDTRTFSDWREAVTTDSGRTWSRRGTSIPGANSKDFAMALFTAASRQQVWVSLSNRQSVMYTADGGESWVDQPTPGPVSGLALNGNWVWALSCARSSGSTCVPVLERGPLVVGPWVRSPLPNVESAGFPQLAGICCNVMLVLAELVGDSPGELFETNDAGRTWTVHSTPSGPSKVCAQDIGVAALSATDWWLLCLGQSAAGSSTGALFHTLNGGSRWTTVNAVTNLGSPHNTLPLGDPGAFGVGSGGKLWLTNQAGMEESADGGITFEEARGVDTEGAGITQVTFDVLFRNLAWLLVPGGGLWDTTGGVNWKRLAANFDG